MLTMQESCHSAPNKCVVILGNHLPSLHATERISNLGQRPAFPQAGNAPRRGVRRI